jgi:hypothetical protein
MGGTRTGKFCILARVLMPAFSSEFSKLGQLYLLLIVEFSLMRDAHCYLMERLTKHDARKLNVLAIRL